MRRTLLAGLLVAACGGPRLVPYAPLERSTGLDERRLYQAAEATLLDRGYLIAARDEAALILVTEPRTVLGSDIAQDRFHDAFRVETRGGTLRIELACRTAGGLGDPGDCEKETPEKVVKERAAIFEQTLAGAKGE